MPGRLIRMEKNNEFDQANKRFDNIMKESREKAKSKVELREKIFMKISDVDKEDADFLKEWCDKHTAGKQFLGIKVIRAILENIDPLVKNILNQLNEMSDRVSMLEGMMGQEQDSKVEIPKTQGGAKNDKR